jgi:hypothetical protein
MQIKGVVNDKPSLVVLNCLDSYLFPVLVAFLCKFIVNLRIMGLDLFNVVNPVLDYEDFKLILKFNKKRFPIFFLLSP